MRGCHLVAMFSRTKIAKQFRIWVLDILDKEVGQPTIKRITITVEQQKQIRFAIAKRCKTNSVHYQTFYTALYAEFDIPRYTELLAADFDAAIAFINSYGVSPSDTERYANSPANNDAEYNFMWRHIGLYQAETMYQSLQNVKHALREAEQQLHIAIATNALMYDALNEQRQPRIADERMEILIQEGLAFINRQMTNKLA